MCTQQLLYTVSYKNWKAIGQCRSMQDVKEQSPSIARSDSEVSCVEFYQNNEEEPVT